MATGQRYTVLKPVNDDGRTVRPTDADPTIVLLPDQVAALVAVGAINPTPGAAARNEPDVTPAAAPVDAGAFGVPLDGISDCYAAIVALLAEIKAGRIRQRVVVFPYTGAGGYKTSAEILIDFGNIRLHFEDDLVGTFTTPQNVLRVQGVNTWPSPARNVIITGNGRVRIDGNRGGISGYSYSGDNLYGALLLRNVQDFYVAGLLFANGLVNSFRTFQSGHGVVERCGFTGAGHDNGCSIDFDPGNYSATDPSTWADVVVRKCWATANNDYGMTAFDASGVTFSDCTAWANGQMTDANGVGGGFSYEDSFSSPKQKNYRGRFVNCHGYGNTGNNFFVTADDVSIDRASTARASVYDDAVKADSAQQFGHGVCGISVRRFVCEARTESNAKAGVKLLGANSVYCDADIGGSHKSNPQRGVDAFGIARFNLLPGFSAESNGMGSVAKREGVYVSNNGANTGGGTAYAKSAEISLNGAAAIKVEYVNRVFMDGVTGYDPGQFAVTSAGLQVANASLAYIANSVIDGGSSQSYVAQITSTAVGAVFNCGGRAVVATINNQATTKPAPASG